MGHFLHPVLRPVLRPEQSCQEFVAGDDACFTIAQRDLVFRLKANANALIIGRADSSGILDMKLKVSQTSTTFRCCTMFNWR